jgi:hypothetical protein
MSSAVCDVKCSAVRLRYMCSTNAVHVKCMCVTCAVYVQYMCSTVQYMCNSCAVPVQSKCSTCALQVQCGSVGSLHGGGKRCQHSSHSLLAPSSDRRGGIQGYCARGGGGNWIRRRGYRWEATAPLGEVRALLPGASGRQQHD